MQALIWVFLSSISGFACVWKACSITFTSSSFHFSNDIPLITTWSSSRFCSTPCLHPSAKKSFWSAQMERTLWLVDTLVLSHCWRMSARILCFAFGASLTSSISLSKMPHMGCWTRRFTRLPMRSLCIFVLSKSSSLKWVPSVWRTRRGGSYSVVFYAGFWNTIVDWWFTWLTSDRFKRHPRNGGLSQER
jgi:hypothetical protein